MKKEDRLQKKCNALRDEVSDGRLKWKHRAKYGRKVNQFNVLQYVLLIAGSQGLAHRKKTQYLKGITPCTLKELEFAIADIPIPDNQCVKAYLNSSFDPRAYKCGVRVPLRDVIGASSS